MSLSCLLLGARKLNLTPAVFTLVLTSLSMIALVKLLTWVLVFVFRRSLIAEEQRRIQEGKMIKATRQRVQQCGRVIPNRRKPNNEGKAQVLCLLTFNFGLEFDSKDYN